MCTLTMSLTQNVCKCFIFSMSRSSNASFRPALLHRVSLYDNNYHNNSVTDSVHACETIVLLVVQSMHCCAVDAWVGACVCVCVVHTYSAKAVQLILRNSKQKDCDKAAGTIACTCFQGTTSLARCLCVWECAQEVPAAKTTSWFHYTQCCRCW